MKSILTFFAIASTSLSAVAQHNLIPDVRSVRSEIFILDSFYHWGWDTLAFDWNLKDRTLYTTDANQNVTSERSILLDSMQQWNNSELTIYTYDTGHKLTNEVLQLWNGTEWVNNMQTVYTYDENGDQIGILRQNWNGTDWSNSFQQIFTYDSNHNQLTRISQLWLGTDWANGTRQVSTYDVNNNIAIRLFQNWNTGWSDVSRSLYRYDGNNDLDTLLYQRWTFNAWNDDYRNLYDFDAHHNRILILEQLAVGINVWEDQDRYDYTYDQYDHITHLIYTHYENNAWSNVYQFNLINDDDQNRATEIFQTWDNEWVNVDSTQYYYTGFTATRDIFEPEPMTLVPNPASDILFVEYPKPIDGLVSIYSVTGTKMLQFKSLHEQAFRINVESLLPGIYFVAIQVGHVLQTKAFEKF